MKAYEGISLKTLLNELKEELRTPLLQWPEDLAFAFIIKMTAFWSEPASNAYDNPDTDRVCRVGDQAEEETFRAIEGRGCCGSHEETWEFDVASGKTIVRYGFNYGH